MKRRHRPFAAVLAMLALLFAQAMTAVHACDMETPAQASVMANAAHATDADCCDHAVPPQDPACDNHCQQGNQAPERAQTPSVPPLAAISVALPTPVAAPAAASQPPVPAPTLSRPTEPPASIRNCCFRI